MKYLPSAKQEAALASSVPSGFLIGFNGYNFMTKHHV